MKKLSYKVSLGGVIAAIALFAMFLTGFAPFFTYICPMAAGLLMIMISIEISPKWAIVTYAAISLLSIFITPDKEAAVIFIFFFGHYPITKIALEKIKSRVVEWIAKMAVFNACVISGYWLIINVFNMTAILDDLGQYGQYALLIFLLCANAVFVLYDFTVSSCVAAYIKWFRPKFLKKLK